MKILFVWPGADFAIRDVGVGLRVGLQTQGHEIFDYELTKRMKYHAAAMRMGGMDPGPDNLAMITKQATETVLLEALYHKVDFVMIISGLNFHPFGLQLLHQVLSPRIRVGVLLTESPYEDQDQAEWCAAHPELIVFTTERTSAKKYGWHYLRHAYIPDVHQPSEPFLEDHCDVVMVGSGWQERQDLLEQVNWDGITLKLIGPWPHLTDASPLAPFHEDRCVPNPQTPRIYASAKICLNYHRQHPEGESMAPRDYELAALGAFQLADVRMEQQEMFGDLIPTFRNANELEGLIRYYLAQPAERTRIAAEARRIVEPHTWDRRAEDLIAVVGAHVGTEAGVTT